MWLLLSVLCLALGACGDDPGPGVVDAAVESRYLPLAEAVETERQALGAPGVAVVVLERGQVTFAMGFGSKHPHRHDPVLATTLFRIGSVTKMLTAVAVLRQVEGGAVSLEDPLRSVVPEFDLPADPTGAASITVRNLLTHTSGLADHLAMVAEPPYRDDDGLAGYLTGPYESTAYLMVPPSTFFNYTNPGFMLAGLVAQEASGTYYRSLLHHDVLAPLGMHRTLFLPEDVLGDGDFAYGDARHWETGQPTVVGPESYLNPWARPAGYAWSSVLDLAAFVGFLRSGDPAVLADVHREAMLSPQQVTEQFTDRHHYGFGVMVQQGVVLGQAFYETRLVNHGGAITGYSADVLWFPELDFAFITLANGDGAYFRQSLDAALTTLCDLPPATVPPDVTTDATTLAGFAGTYHDPEVAGTLHITRDGTGLRIAAPDLDGLGVVFEPALEPLSPRNFVLTLQDQPVIVTFLPRDENPPRWLRTRYFVGERVSSVPPPRPLRSVEPRFGPWRLRPRPWWFPRASRSASPGVASIPLYGPGGHGLRWMSRIR